MLWLCNDCCSSIWMFVRRSCDDCWCGLCLLGWFCSEESLWKCQLLGFTFCWRFVIRRERISAMSCTSKLMKLLRWPLFVLPGSFCTGILKSGWYSFRRHDVIVTFFLHCMRFSCLWFVSAFTDFILQFCTAPFYGKVHEVYDLNLKCFFPFQFVSTNSCFLFFQ